MAAGSLDTNIVLRVLLQDQPQTAARIMDMIEKANTNSLAVADVVLFETVWVMQGGSYKLDRELIAKLLQRFVRIEQINCNQVLFEMVLPLYVKHPGLSFIDVALACYAELSDATPLLTLDKKLAKALPGYAKVPALQ
jgi:predicted nucleic-acid-binding protein